MQWLAQSWLAACHTWCVTRLPCVLRLLCAVDAKNKLVAYWSPVIATVALVSEAAGAKAFLSGMSW